MLAHAMAALEIIPNLDTKFDLVFIDADKPNYINYFHEIIEKLNPTKNQKYSLEKCKKSLENVLKEVDFLDSKIVNVNEWRQKSDIAFNIK